MMLNLFLPDSIRGYQLIARRLACISLHANHLVVTVLTYKGKVRSLDDYFQIPLISASDEGIVDALRAAKERIGQISELHLLLPSSKVLFKEITLPFTDNQQLRLVLPAQLEPLMPFPLAQAYVDFIITRQTATSSTLLVGIAAQEQINPYTRLFQQAGLTIFCVGVDSLAYWYLQQQTIQQPNDCLVVVDATQTTIITSNESTIIAIRTINKGLATIAAAVAQQHQLEIATMQAHLHKMLAGGTLPHHLNQDMQKGLQGLIDEIQFTLQALTKQSKIAALDILAFTDIRLLQQQLERQLASVVRIINSKTFLAAEHIQHTANNALDEYGIALIAALTLPPYFHMNLLRTQEVTAERIFFIRSLTVAGLLSLGVLLLMGGFTWWQTARLAQQVERSKKEAITTLQKSLDLADSSSLRTIEDAVQAAHTYIEQENAVWFAFSGASRLGFLKALQELTELLDKKSLGLQIKKMILEPTRIMMTASVRGYPELKMFEDEISKSELFTLANIPQEPNFTVTLLIQQ